MIRIICCLPAARIMLTQKTIANIYASDPHAFSVDRCRRMVFTNQRKASFRQDISHLLYTIQIFPNTRKPCDDTVHC